VAEFDLCEDEVFSVANDEIYFAAARSVVAFDEAVAAPGEVA
jgi:hypothetical protein